mgnify:CR=1 FL=1
MDRNQMYQMNIDSGAFAAMREDFNKVLTRTLKNALNKEGDCAELTIKLKISLERTKAPNFDPCGDPEKDIVKPKFDHKVGSVMNIKDEESGSFKGEYELVWDEDLQDFVVRPIDNGQMDLFTTRDGNGDIIYECEAEEVLELPPAPQLLKAPASDPDDDDGGDDNETLIYPEPDFNDLEYPEPEDDQ